MPEQAPGFAVVPSRALDQLEAAMRARLLERGVSGPVFYSTLEAGGGLLIVALRPVEREGSPGGYFASGFALGDDFQFVMHGEPGIELDAVCLHWGILTYRYAVSEEQQKRIGGRLQWRPPKRGPE
jgi:hypothetical protein